MHHVGRVAALTLAFVCLGGCGEATLVGYGNTVSVYGTYGYHVTASGVRTDGQRYLRRSISEVSDTDSIEEQLQIAVQVLLDSRQIAPAPGDVTHWHGRCAPGRRVEDVELHGDLVVVRLAGSVPRHRSCALTAPEREVLRQQVAWTVRHNVDPFAEEEPPVVRVVEPNGDRWDAVADWSYIEPAHRLAG